MKSDKVIVVLIVLLVIFAFLFYWCIGKGRMERREYNLVMITESNSTWNYRGYSWFKENNIKDYNWKKMDVFLDGQYKGKYYIWHDDKWYIFDDNKEAVNSTENFLAIESNFEVKAKNFEMIENENDTIVEKILRDNDLFDIEDLTVNQKATVDIDSDGINENIYIISNTFPLDFAPDYTFSLVFMEKSGTIYKIYQHETNNMYDGVRPFINAIIDTNNDNIYEIVLTTSEYSTQKTGNLLFEWKNNIFQKLMES